MTDEPIRIYKPNPVSGWVIAYGDGVEDHAHPELAEAKAAADANAGGREVVVVDERAGG